jgi:RHS repeat-associated protein
LVQAIYAEEIELHQTPDWADKPYSLQRDPLWKVTKTPKDFKDFWFYHCDYLGTPQEMTDHTGAVIWKAEYKAWGECKAEKAKSNFFEDSEIISNNIRFQGQYLDQETGLHYNRYRYYSPYVGRFISKDPIGLLGGDNLYAYAPNPIVWVDSLGLNKKLTLSQQQERAVSAVNRLRAQELSKPASQRARVVNAIVTEDGNILTGINNRTNVTGYTLLDKAPNSIKTAYSNVPENERGNGHGNCAEASSLSKGVNSKKHMKNAVSIAMVVDSGRYIQGCGSCSAVLAGFQINDAVKRDGRLKY